MERDGWEDGRMGREASGQSAELLLLHSPSFAALGHCKFWLC